MRIRSVPAAVLCTFVVIACSDSSGPGVVGPLDRLAISSGGDNQRAPAATMLSQPIVIIPQDANGQTVTDKTATFAVTAGGGSIANTTGQVNPDGTITAPAWTLGKSDVPQELTVTIEGKSTVVRASVQTAYVLSVRFFGAPVATIYQAAFTAAAARVRGFIVGEVPPVTFTGQTMEFCTGTGSPPINETVNGLLIFAAVDSIDGPQKILAQAGPCYYRTGGFLTIVGLMQFDSADIGSLSTGGRLEDVIIHEMLHVVGLGSFWPDANLLTGAGSPGAGYTGASGIAACRAMGGSLTCATHVPVEDCVGLPTGTPCGDGQRDAHWKETTFGRELMTAYLGSGGTNPLSVMSIRSFEDLGYTVNPAPADPYTLSALSAFTSAETTALAAGVLRDWERPLRVSPRAFPAGAPSTSSR